MRELLRVGVAAALACGLTAACTESSSDSADAASGTDFQGGTFQFTTTAVSDGCADKAFEVIFMPSGMPNAWDTTTELPSF